MKKERTRPIFSRQLRLIKDRRAIPDLRAAYDKYRRAQEIGSDPSPTLDYLECCAALLDIEGARSTKRQLKTLRGVRTGRYVAMPSSC